MSNEPWDEHTVTALSNPAFTAAFSVMFTVAWSGKQNKEPCTLYT